MAFILKSRLVGFSRLDFPMEATNRHHSGQTNLSSSTIDITRHQYAGRNRHKEPHRYECDRSNDGEP
jgi:hypothetical protein